MSKADIFKRMLGSRWGRGASRAMPAAVRWLFRTDAQFEPTIPRSSITTDDLGPDGQLYPDYLERRAAREAANTKSDGQEFGVYDPR